MFEIERGLRAPQGRRNKGWKHPFLGTLCPWNYMNQGDSFVVPVQRPDSADGKFYPEQILQMQYTIKRIKDQVRKSYLRWLKHNNDTLGPVINAEEQELRFEEVHLGLRVFLVNVNA